MLKQIKRLFLKSDNTEFDITAIKYIQLSSKGNVNFSSPTASESSDGKDKSINFEPAKHIKFKPGAGSQIEFLADHTGDLSEVLLKFLKGITEDGTELDKEIPIRAKFNCQEMEFNTKGCSDTNAFDVKFKTGLKDTSSGEHYCQTKLKGRSFDIRCYEHGGIALQPCGKDSNGFENKIKFESSRTSSIGSEGTYNSEGGKGLEFGTFNNLHSSLFTKDYRFNVDGKIYAVTRRLDTSDPEKVDYETQGDDFKDIINVSQASVTWRDVINAVTYLKNNGNLPDTGFILPVMQAPIDPVPVA